MTCQSSQNVILFHHYIGWEDHGDQVVLVVRNIRHAMDSYHDILSDIDYAKTWREVRFNDDSCALEYCRHPFLSRALISHSHDHHY